MAVVDRRQRRRRLWCCGRGRAPRRPRAGGCTAPPVARAIAQVRIPRGEIPTVIPSSNRSRLFFPIHVSLSLKLARALHILVQIDRPRPRPQLYVHAAYMAQQQSRPDHVVVDCGHRTSIRQRRRRRRQPTQRRGRRQTSFRTLPRLPNPNRNENRTRSILS